MTIIVRPGVSPSRATVVGHDPTDSDIPGPTTPEKAQQRAVCDSISKLLLRDMVLGGVWAQVGHVRYNIKSRMGHQF